MEFPREFGYTTLVVDRDKSSWHLKSAQVGDDFCHQLAGFSRVEPDLHPGFSQRIHLALSGSLAT